MKRISGENLAFGATIAGLVAGGSALGYHWYEEFVHQYDLSGKDSARLEQVLRPSAIKAGRAVTALEHDVAPDTSVPGGYEVTTTLADGPVRYRLEADMKRFGGELDPASTYGVTIRRLDQTINEPQVLKIRQHDPSEYSNGDVWYGDVDLTLRLNGTEVPFSQDTHVDDPKDKDSVDWAVSNAAAEQEFIDEILDPLSNH